MNIYKYTLIPILILILASPKIFSQDKFQVMLNQATEYYEQGYYKKVTELLEGKIEKCKCSRQENIEALKLIISAYSQIDEIEKSEIYVQKFMRKAPYYRVNSTTDPTHFINGINNFSVYPRINVGLSIGAGKLNPIITSNNIIFSDFDYNQAYQFGFNFSIKGFVEYNILKRISLGISVQPQIIGFEKKYRYKNNVSVDYFEDMIFLNNQAYMKFNFFTSKRLRTDLFFGVHRKSTIKSSYEISNSTQINGQSTGKEKNGNFDKYERTNVLNGYFIGGRLKYKLYRVDVFLQILQSWDLDEYITIEQANKMDERYMEYYHTNNALQMTNMELSVGFSYSFFNKIKRKY